MKYSNKFPCMIPVIDEFENIIRGRTPKPCYVCNRITEYTEVNYGVALCSEECLDKLELMIGEEIDSHLTPIDDSEDDDMDWLF